MPANLSPDYLSAEQDYREARTPAEKIAALERMMATIPKHKGTEKLQAEIRRRLSQARKDCQKKGAAHSTPFYLIPKEGAGQVALIGPPNSGKSQLLRSLTHAEPEVADYPFTTRFPTPGMMAFENIQIQLVDLPPVAPEYTETWIPQVLRNATTGLLVVDPNDLAVLDQIDFIQRTLDAWRLPPPGLLAATKLDQPGGPENFRALAELYGTRWAYVALSAREGLNLDSFRRAVFDLLGVVRVYTKAPGKRAELASPYVLRRGETVGDAARHVHKDFAEHLKFARLFRPGGHRDGLMVERTHIVEDEDILEFHI